MKFYVMKENGKWEEVDMNSDLVYRKGAVGDNWFRFNPRQHKSVLNKKENNNWVDQVK